MKTITHARWEPWHWACAISLAALSVAVTWNAWKDIYTIAEADPEQSHIFLVPIVAIWMVWARRIRLRNCPPSGTFVGPIVAGLGVLMSLWGFEQNMQSIWHAGAVALLVGSLITALGKNVLFQFLPAVVVLVFLVPIPGFIRTEVSVPLQTATAYVTQVLLETFGIPLERSQNLLRINGQDVAVAEACNGMRMVFGLVLVAYAFAFSMPLRGSTRALILIFSPVAALFCNVVRLVPTVLLYGYSGTKWGDWFHDWSGWLMLPIAFFLLMGVLRILKWALLPVMRYNLAYH
jgi:exosortase